ncbi:DUF317 domain-containing protein [Streptomyces sp. NPDC003077]|uniref:DUF317 domain-containing protein n=1 Tax=Streptomyces sp. NPDC003077 TaxID=3154443 RepID=UPI0033B8ACD4
MRDFAPEDRVLVSPRHLAGGGTERLGDVIGPLIHLFGWRYHHEAATGHVTLDSPDHSVLFDFTPGRSDGTWWRIAHHDPYWEAEFSRQTPVESLAALSQALPQFLGDRRHAERIPVTTATLAQIAALNHWTAAPDQTAFASPDGRCVLRHAPDAETAWRFRHAVHDGFDTHWQAIFTRQVPEALVAQFFAHLATPEPVERAFRDIPYLARDLGQALITPVRGAAVSPRVHHAVAQAARTHPARRR